MTFIRQDKFRANGDWVWTRRCTNAEMVIAKDGTKQYKMDGIYVSDRFGDTTLWARIMGVGPKCKDIGVQHIGKYVQLPEFSNGHERAPAIGMSEDDPSVKDREDFFTKEDVLLKTFPAILEKE